MTDTVFAEVEHHDALLTAIRQRIIELDTTYEAIEYLSGLQPGYLPKILGDPPPKRLQPFLMFILLKTLGLKTALIHDPEFNEKLAGRLTKRRTKRSIRSGGQHKTIKIELTPDLMRHIAHLGVRGRMRKTTPQQRSAVARHAAMTRWRRARELKEMPAQ